MTGNRKIAVVTGANRGIGQAIAAGLAAHGMHVVLVCRRREDGERAIEAIRASTPGASCDVETADLSSRADVARLAETLVRRFPRIDVLVNNAAVAIKSRTESVDGIEMTLAVNHLAPFALALDILPSLGPGSRVINVSSESQQGMKIILDDLEAKRRPYGGVRAYGETKLMNVLFTQELARRGEPRGITTFVMHPGVIGTRLLLDYLPSFLRPLVRWYAKTPEDGADTAVWLATDPGVTSQSGGYFIKRRPARPNPLGTDPGLAKALWEASERMTGVRWTA